MNMERETPRAMGIATEATNLTKSERITQVAEKPKLLKVTFVDFLGLSKIGPKPNRLKLAVRA